MFALLEEYVWLGLAIIGILVGIGLFSSPKKFLPVAIALFLMLLLGSIMVSVGVVRTVGSSAITGVTADGNKVIDINYSQVPINVQDDFLLFFIGNFLLYGGVFGMGYVLMRIIDGRLE